MTREQERQTVGQIHRQTDRQRHGQTENWCKTDVQGDKQNRGRQTDRDTETNRESIEREGRVG